MNPLASLPPRQAPATVEGSEFTLPWYGCFAKLKALFQSGFNGTVPVGKLTTGGANGSITFVNGVATNIVNPT